MADPELDKRSLEPVFDGTVPAYSGDTGSIFYGRLRDGADAVGARANATVNGAHSIFPGTLNLPRSILRAAGLFGKAEAHRFDDEMAAAGAALGQIVKHPEPALRAAGEAFSTAWNDPLFPFYLAGRAGMGLRTRLGPFAVVGDTLRALEDGHNLDDAVTYSGILGRPPPGGLLGIPPQGRGLLSIPPEDRR